ncbi:MAG: D-alanyl-D-alanine carboxypeptidase [Clostridia bacterium]|nr:D-alanyl-D-alanine carboxypeptidase [Clostridia bacterium]
MKRIIIIFLLVAALPLRSFALETEGRSALLMEASTGTVLYEQDADMPLAPASVTKVMTMLLIMEAIDSGSISWEDTVTASAAAAAKGGSQVYLKEGETMSVREMLKSIAVSSANDCACAMAEHIAGSEEAFVERMNARAKELGMENTHFVNCTGLDDGPEASEHRTTARDIAIMSRELLVEHPAIKEFTTIWMDTIRDGAFGLSNTNKLVRFYPGATGLKTGFTASAMYCLSASAQRDGMELIAVVMGAPTSAARFNACKAMLDYGFAGWTVYTPELPEAAEVPVRLGKAATVRAAADTAPILVEKARKASLRCETVLEEELPAPVAEGQTLGTVRIWAGEELLAERPLTAEAAVEKLTWSDVFLELLRKLVCG